MVTYQMPDAHDADARLAGGAGARRPAAKDNGEAQLFQKILRHYAQHIMQAEGTDYRVRNDIGHDNFVITNQGWETAEGLKTMVARCVEHFALGTSIDVPRRIERSRVSPKDDSLLVPRSWIDPQRLIKVSNEIAPEGTVVKKRFPANDEPDDLLRADAMHPRGSYRRYPC